MTVHHFEKHSFEARLTEAKEMLRGIEQAEKLYFQSHNAFFNANTPAQFKAFGVEIEFGYFTYESASSFDRVVTRATYKNGGWIELEVSRDNEKSFRCDGDVILQSMIAG